MPGVIINFFSGTGNTAHAVNRIAESLRSEGTRVTLCRITKQSIPAQMPDEHRIIAFPVLSWAAPVLVKQFVRRMPVSEGTKVALLAVNGATIKNGKLIKGYTGQALEQIETILKRKKYDVHLTANASFPENLTQVTNPCNTEVSRTIYRIGEQEVDDFTAKFIHGKTELYRCGALNRIWSGSVAGLFGAVGRRSMGKFYIADNNCTGCGICARICPADTIRMRQGKPHWKFNCEDCNRCINLCPKKAIQVSLPLFILHIGINLILTIWAIRLIITYIPLLFQSGSVFIPLLEILAVVLAYPVLLWFSFGPVDAFFQVLMRIKIVRKIFSISHTRSFGRYAAPGFNPLVPEM